MQETAGPGFLFYPTITLENLTIVNRETRSREASDRCIYIGAKITESKSAPGSQMAEEGDDGEICSRSGSRTDSTVHVIIATYIHSSEMIGIGHVETAPALT